MILAGAQIDAMLFRALRQTFQTFAVRRCPRHWNVLGIYLWIIDLFSR